MALASADINTSAKALTISRIRSVPPSASRCLRNQAPGFIVSGTSTAFLLRLVLPGTPEVDAVVVASEGWSGPQARSFTHSYTTPMDSTRTSIGVEFLEVGASARPGSHRRSAGVQVVGDLGPAGPDLGNERFAAATARSGSGRRGSPPHLLGRRLNRLRQSSHLKSSRAWCSGRPPRRFRSTSGPGTGLGCSKGGSARPLR